MTLLIASLVMLSAIMLAGWAWQEKRRNGGWADVFWTFGLGAVGCGGSLAVASNSRGWIVATTVAAWSLRLGLHIAERALHGPEDSRYAALRREWGARAKWRMLAFLQIQALAAFALTLAMLAAARSPAPLGAHDALAGAIIIIAIGGEAVSDWQLRAFRRQAIAGDRICDRGMWRLSRHPNYFFEWLLWFAYPAFAYGSPLFWPSFAAPLLMYWLLVHVSGIPPLEAQMLATRGDAYRAYQARVRAFFPIPKELAR
jgi:steroid 5-alpha reductase family enzyme